MNRKQKITIKLKDNSLNEKIANSLSTVGQVKVIGLGVFEIKKMKDRFTYNIGTGKNSIQKGFNKIKFRPTKSLKDIVQKYE